jgi:hypothetical protein
MTEPFATAFETDIEFERYVLDRAMPVVQGGQTGPASITGIIYLDDRPPDKNRRTARSHSWIINGSGCGKPRTSATYVLSGLENSRYSNRACPSQRGRSKEILHDM